MCAVNAAGRPWPMPGLERWLRLNRTVFKTPRVDVLGGHAVPMPPLLEAARRLDMALSLRTDCVAEPEALHSLRDAGLADVFLCPGSSGGFEKWLAAAHEAGLRPRVQLLPGFEPPGGPEEAAGRFAEKGVVSVNLALHDPFTTGAPPPAIHDALRAFQTLADALAAQSIPVNLLWTPFCLVEQRFWRNVVNSRQFHLDPGQYQRESYQLAARLFQRAPAWADKAVAMLLGRHTSYPNPIDAKLMPWLLDRPWLRARIWAWHKLTRHWRTPFSPPRAVQETTDAQGDNPPVRPEAFDPACGRCRLRRICDGLTPPLRKAYPGIEVRPVDGELVVSPLEFALQRPDRDSPAGSPPPFEPELAEAANAIVNGRPPDREIDAFSYQAEREWSWQLAGSVRWFAHTNSEQTSTPLARLEPPFTLAATFGGGIAEYIGFAFGRDARLLCPMTAFSHRLVLHAAADGRYVFLRDGQAVVPSEFIGGCYTPTRLSGVVEPRLALWNIDGTVGTQGVLLWEHGETGKLEREPAQLSVVVVSTRYARRLEACLRNLAHQQGLAPGALEVIVAMVPGIDATGDVIESVQNAYPHLRIVRSAFSEDHVRAKGYMINESAKLASGQWVILLDADILLHPGMLAAIAAESEDRHFVVPDGRKMLTPETTARVLLGDIEPWAHWDKLLSGPGEFRLSEAEGVPVGFCQCVREEVMREVPYEEHQHFEGADWKFAVDVRERFGKEKRLSGMPVLHLDHGVSNWYGAPSHK